jgi:integrase
MRNATLVGYKNKIEMFRRINNISDVAQVSVDLAKQYLAEIKSPDHQQRALRPFFEFCISQNWIVSNPFILPKKKNLGEKKEVSILSIEQTKLFFEKCPKEWRPTFALMAFAGIRPMEISFNPSEPKDVLKIGDIDFKNKTIRIKASVAKTRTPRLLSCLSDNLWKWILPLKDKPKDEDASFGTYDQNHNVRYSLGVSATDLFRHSFGTYGYYYFGAERTIDLLGHVREFKTYVEHYKGLTDEDGAKEYFSIMPK